MKIKELSMFIVALLLLASCSQEQEAVSGVSGDAVSVRLSFATTPMQQGGDVGTRSTDASTVDEETISNLWVLQYVDGTYVRSRYFPGNINVKVFDVELSANVSGATSDLYFVANVGALAFPTIPTTAALFQAAATAVTTEASILPTAGFIPMYGELKAVSIPDEFSGTAQVNMTRTLARVDFVYSLSDELKANFTIDRIRVCNVPDKAYYYAPTDESAFPASPTVLNLAYEAGSSAGGSLTFYLPDNRRGTGTNVAGPVTDKAGVPNATYIELSGVINGEEIFYKIYPGADNTNDYNLKRNTHYTIDAEITGVYASDKRVSKNSTSNCYMVKPGESVKIPVKRANQSDLGVQLPDLTTGWTASVIWRDNHYITLTLSEALKSKGMFEISTNAGQEGNALVCIKDDSGNILWSWHIWVTGYDPSVTNHSYNSLIWMDRNLGAQNTTKGNYGSLGYLYQWGRKDPFAGAYPAAAGTTTLRSLYSGASGSSTYSVPVPIAAPTTSANNLQNSVRNPSLFYFKTDPPYVWYPGSATTQNDALWGATKTVYDPCPQGWKVPANGAWPSTLTTSTSTWDASYLGRTITATSAWYPAAGCRHSTTGTLSFVGASCYYWSSTVYGTYAYALTFSSNFVDPSYNVSRAYGCGLRCVQE